MQYVYVSTYIHVCLHGDKYICLYTFLNVYIDIAYMHAHTYIHACIHTYMCVMCIYVPTYTHICPYMAVYIHVYTFMHIYNVYKSFT